MLTDSEARIAIVEPRGSAGGVSVTTVARVPLRKADSIEDRLRDLGAELNALGCGRRSLMWVACSLPEMSFATVTVEKMALNKLAPVAWMKFRKEVENLPEKVIFDFEVPEQESGGVVSMWDLTAFATPYDELEEIEGWFASRYKLQGVTTDMFADRNLLDRSEDRDETVALLSCDKDISRIMQIKSGRTTFTRTIKAGSGTLLGLVERELDRSVTVDELETILNMSDSEYLTYANPDKDQILQACSAGVNRLFTQVGRALDYYTDHLKNPRPKKLFLTGRTDLLKRFIPELSNRLMLDVQLLDPEVGDISFTEEVEDLLGGDGAERYSSAIGVALGQAGHTPNLICTHDVKERLLKIARVRALIASGFIGLAVLLFTGLMWQVNQIRKHSSELKAMESRPAKGLLHITIEHADEKVGEIRRKHEEALLLAARYKLVSALSEVQSLTPDGILLKKMILKADVKERTGLSMEGVVIDVDGTAASHLAKYVVELNASPMFTQVFITSQSETEEAAAMKLKGVLPFKVEGRFVDALSEK